MSEKEINIIYDFEEENYIRIFGRRFVENNRNKCKILIDNNEYEIEEYFNIENYKKNNNKLWFKIKIH